MCLKMSHDRGEQNSDLYNHFQTVWLSIKDVKFDQEVYNLSLIVIPELFKNTQCCV